MLCEIDKLGDSFLTTWLVLSALGLVSLLLLSGSIFSYYYVYPSYEKWTWKTNKAYPKPEMVRDEITQMLKGLLSATICPALSLWMARKGYNHAFCGLGGWSLSYNLMTFTIVWLASDFYEFYYHRLGHMTSWGWANHRHHHKFFNPSPFAVIADEYVDQFLRALPLVFLPYFMPLNLDMLFFTYAIFFYGYGVYLHWGHEMSFPGAHHPVLNSAYHHYLHHAKSIINKPFHTGFFFKIWDQLFQSEYPGACLCVKCQPKRTLEEFQQIDKPDYSVLLNLDFWISKGILNVNPGSSSSSVKSK